MVCSARIKRQIYISMLPAIIHLPKLENKHKMEKEREPHMPFTNGCTSTHMHIKEVHSAITQWELAPLSTGVESHSLRVNVYTAMWLHVFHKKLGNKRINDTSTIILFLELIQKT